MSHFTSYAENKFALLNEHGVFLRREQVESALATPDEVGKIGRFLTARKDGVKVVYQKQGGLTKVITFYPA